MSDVDAPSPLLAIAVVLSALPLTAAGLIGTIERHRAALAGKTLPGLTERILGLGDAVLVAIGLGGAILGVLGAIFLPGRLRTFIAVFIMLLMSYLFAIVAAGLDLPLVSR
jgi:hypothetical protein